MATLQTVLRDLPAAMGMMEDRFREIITHAADNP